MAESNEYRNALETGATLAEYQLKSVLGVGGFGMTYLAWDGNLEKHVAIKEYLPGDLAVRALDGSVVPVSTNHQYDYQWGLERFILEARTLARFSHPHIVRVNRYFEANGTGYMVMDYEEGESLSQLLKRAPLPAETELRRILLPLLDGLAAVHVANFLHRDIKPSNIFMRANGSPVLLDFGAARATGGGTRSLTAVLTPGYAPLEQYSADGKQGPWSDIYAMAGVLYRVVTDRNPPDAVSRLQNDGVKSGLASAQGRYSAPLLRAIEWALSVKAEMRPQTVAEWKAALDAQTTVTMTQPASAAGATVTAATVRTVAAPAPATRPATVRAVPVQPDHGSSWRRIGWMMVWIIGVVVVVTWYKRRPEPQPVPAPVVQSMRQPPPVQVQVVPTAPPGVPAPATDVVMVQPVDPRPSRELAPEADSRERPSRPDTTPSVPERARERLGEDFRVADRDGDGYLSQAEVEGRFPGIARDFAKVDLNDDRRISLDEFIELRRQQFEGRKAAVQGR
jgi:serine/threonine protein kinase